MFLKTKVLVVWLLLLLLSCWDCQSSFQQQDSKKISNCNKLIGICEKHQGYSYIWGGESKEDGGFDCSGFIYSIFKKYGKPIPRTTSKKYWIFLNLNQLIGTIQNVDILFGGVLILQDLMDILEL